MNSLLINRRMREELRRIRLWHALRIGQQPVVKVYGLLRTGTNYLTRLIELNFRAFCLASTEEGWKHGPCNYDPDLKYVFAVKDPYSWLVSFMDWEIIHGRFTGQSMKEFIAGPVTHPQLKKAWGCSDVLSAWNRSLGEWRQYMQKPNAVFVRYEDLTESYEAELSRIGDTLGLRQRNTAFMDLDARADDWKTPRPRKERHQDYYREAHYLQHFTRDDLEIIRNKLDPDLVDAFGYMLLQTRQ